MNSQFSIKNQQNFYPTDYYLTTPKDRDYLNFRRFINRPYNGNLFMPIDIVPYIQESCPFYAPIVYNGNCRFCCLTPDAHKKYFTYSIYASKIQRCFFRYKFKKIISNNFNILQKNSSHFPIPILIQKFKRKYYRKWSKYNFEQFVLHCK